MVICKTCGKQLVSGTKFCIGCGASVAGEQETSHVPAQHIPQQVAGLSQTATLRKQLVRSFTVALVALVIATMLLSWITISFEPGRDTIDGIMDNLDNVITEWLDAQVDLLDVEVMLQEIREHDSVITRVDEFIDEIMESIKRDFGEHIELVSDFGAKDLLTDQAIQDLASDADEFIEEFLDELIGETMHEIRYIADSLSVLSLSASYSVYSLAYTVRLIRATAEAAELAAGISVPDLSTAVLVANILRVVWLMCILLLVSFLFLMTVEFKASRLVGLIGTGFAFVLALVFAIGLFVSNSMYSDVFFGFIQFGATIWVYICLGLSLAAIVLSAVYKKEI